MAIEVKKLNSRAMLNLRMDIARLSRYLKDKPDSPRAGRWQRDLALAQINYKCEVAEHYIRAIMDSDPPLEYDTRCWLASMIVPEDYEEEYTEEMR